MPTPVYSYSYAYDAYCWPARSYYDNRSGWSGDHVSSYRYTRCKEFSRGRHKYKYGNFWRKLDAGNWPGRHVLPLHKQSSTYNQAYRRFREKVSAATASLGMTFAEFPRTANMVHARARSVLEFTKRLYKQYHRKLSRGKNVPERFSDYWLEYSFGWAPAFGDIHNGMKVLAGDVPARKDAKGSAKDSDEVDLDPTLFRRTFYRVKITAKVTVTNPNLYLLNSLGLLNPAEIIWDRMKWSFVLDWLFDMGTVIRSWSDDFGLSFESQTYSRVSLTTHRYVATGDWEGLNTVSSLFAERDLTISFPVPNLDIPKNIGNSLKRAANALALTGQLVGGAKRRFNLRDPDY